MNIFKKKAHCLITFILAALLIGPIGILAGNENSDNENTPLIPKEKEKKKNSKQTISNKLLIKSEKSELLNQSIKKQPEEKSNSLSYYSFDEFMHEFLVHMKAPLISQANNSETIIWTFPKGGSHHAQLIELIQKGNETPNLLHKILSNIKAEKMSAYPAETVKQLVIVKNEFTRLTEIYNQSKKANYQSELFQLLNSILLAEENANECLSVYKLAEELLHYIEIIADLTYTEEITKCFNGWINVLKKFKHLSSEQFITKEMKNLEEIEKYLFNFKKHQSKLAEIQPKYPTHTKMLVKIKSELKNQLKGIVDRCKNLHEHFKSNIEREKKDFMKKFEVNELFLSWSYLIQESVMENTLKLIKQMIEPTLTGQIKAWLGF